MVNIKSTSNAIWWIKNPNAAKLGNGGGRGRGRKGSLGSGFCLDMAELLRNISLQGYSKLLATELTLVERLIWLLVHMTTFIGMLAVLLLTWEQFIAQYFVINLKDPLYPVENVPFPAVSICSNNRISLQAATNYAQELQHNDPSPRRLEYYMDQLKYLHMLYSFGEGTVDTDSFQAFLDIFGTWNNETFFDTRRIMTMLAPSCKDFILNCRLANIDIPCFSEDAFQDGLTRYGACCIFNTNNKYKHRDYKNSFAYAALGLTVVINASHADYFLPVLNTNGYIVIVHDPDNFPSISSSNSLEMHPGQREESYLKIHARVIDTDKSLRSISPFGRRCYFRNEGNLSLSELRGTRQYAYTFPNCITRCRIRSIVALCNCLPFQLPLEMVETLDGLVYCTLTHVSCLAQYQFKWNNVLTERVRVAGMEREFEEALYCPQCLPSCYDVQYRVDLSALPLDIYLATLKSYEANLKTYENNETQLSTDISVLKVYYGMPHAQLYIRLLNNEWFEIFSTIGNILSVFMGFSMVAIFEILFFFFKYIYMGCWRIIDISRDNTNAQKLDARELHICP